MYGCRDRLTGGQSAVMARRGHGNLNTRYGDVCGLACPCGEFPFRTFPPHTHQMSIAEIAFTNAGAVTCMPKEALVLARCAPTQVSVPVEVQPLVSRTRRPATFAGQRIGPRTFFGSRCRTQGGVMAVYRGKHCRETDLARHNGGDDEVTS